MIKRVTAFTCFIALAACGGGGGMGTSAVPSRPMQTQGSVVVTFKVPAKAQQLRAHLRGSLVPQYASPATLGAGISLAVPPATPPPASSPTIALDLSTCSSANFCVNNPDGSRSYTVSSPTVPVGQYTVAIATWDSAPVANAFSGNELSDGQATVTINAVNTPLNVTLNGVPHSVTVAPVPGQPHVQSDLASSGWDIIGTVPTSWIVTAEDADGYVIAGNGAPQFTFTDTTGSLTESTSPASNVYTINAVAAQPTPVTLTVSAKGLGPSGVVAASPALVDITPLQEMWLTLTGTGPYIGINGMALYPAVGYQPNNSSSGGSTVIVDTDHFTTTDSFGGIAQDSAGMLWVYDSTTNSIVQFRVLGTGQLSPTGTAISTTGKVIEGLAADGHGFLYAVDMSSNTLLSWKVVGGSPSLAFTTSLSGTSPTSVAMVPNNGNVPAAIKDAVMVSDSSGVDFYTNASAGTPSHIGSAPGATSTAVTTASISPDTGHLWTIESGYVAPYTINSASSITPLATPSNYSSWTFVSIATGIQDYSFFGSSVGNLYEMFYNGSLLNENAFSYGIVPTVPTSQTIVP